MTIVQLTPDSTLVGAAVELANAVSRAEQPWQVPDTVANRRHDIARGWDGEPPRTYLDVEDGQPIVLGTIHGSDYDNRTLAWLEVEVHPAHRRQGHGSRMLAHLEAEAVASGRTTLTLSGFESEAARAFAERHGYRLLSQAIVRTMPVTEVPREHIQELYDEALAHAGDYELVRMVGHAPADLLDALAQLTEAINDAPLDDLEVEDEVFDAARVRAYEDAQEAGGRTLYRLVARHRETGELAGHTIVAVERARPWAGENHDTAVAAAHRGHRLGLLLKSAMVLWLADAEPGLSVIETGNAESNAYMIGVNERLGYRVMARQLEFQKKV